MMAKVGGSGTLGSSPKIARRRPSRTGLLAVAVTAIN